MTKPSFIDSDLIEGVALKQPARHDDKRGWLMEFFRSDEIGADIYPAMGYISLTNPNTGRGPHEHEDQTDYFFFPGVGRFLLVLWDNRKSSPTYRHRIARTVGEGHQCVATVPPGVVHGYHCVSSAAGLVVNVPNRLFRGQNKRGAVDEIRHEDDPASEFVLDFARAVEVFR